MPEKIAAPGATGDPVKDYAAGLIRDPNAEPAAADPEFEAVVGATGDATKDYAAGLIANPDPEADCDATLTEVVDIDDTPKADLQDRAIELGLPYSGTKAEIAERIRDAEAEA